MGLRDKLASAIIVLILAGLAAGCSGNNENSQNLDIQANLDSKTIPTIEIETISSTPTIESTEIIEPTPTVEPTVELSYDPIENGFVSIYTSDGETLAGFVTLPDEDIDRQVALILGHENASNYHSWDPLIEDLAGMGYTVLAFDFRGHGESSGSEDYSTLKEDVDSVIRYLDFQGFDQIVCTGSSQGGTGCLASTLSTDSIVGLILISAPMNIRERHIKRSYIESLVIPKLVIVAENDSATYTTPDFVTDILKMYEWAAEPKSLYLDPGFLHGTALLYGESGTEGRNMFFDFLSSILDSLEQ
jgi:pimeloyl-ACP methyl ester carboxylesterase